MTGTEDCMRVKGRAPTNGSGQRTEKIQIQIQIQIEGDRAPTNAIKELFSKLQIYSSYQTSKIILKRSTEVFLER